MRFKMKQPPKSLVSYLPTPHGCSICHKASKMALDDDGWALNINLSYSERKHVFKTVF